MKYVSIFAVFFVVPPALSEGNALVVAIGCALALAGVLVGSNA